MSLTEVGHFYLKVYMKCLAVCISGCPKFGYEYTYTASSDIINMLTVQWRKLV